MVGPLTYLDVVLLAIALISGLLAMYRGFTREVLSIISWALAAAAAAYFFFFQPEIGVRYLNPYFQNETLSLISFCVIIFIAVLMIVHFLTINFSDAILDSQVGAIDRTLGLAFGVLRGFLLVAIIYTGLSLFVRQTDYPQWVEQSQSYPYLEKSAKFLKTAFKKFVPSNFKIPGKEESDPKILNDTGTEQESNIINNDNKSLASRIDQAIENKSNDKPYKNSSRSSLDQLIEMQQSQ